MDISQTSLQVEPQPTLPPPKTQDQEHELANHQRKREKDNMARLPRVPRVTDDCPQPMTLDEMSEWKDLYLMKLRPKTQSERDDYSECDRQFNDAISVTTIDWEEDEEYMDTCPSPKQRTCAAWTPGYQARRDARKRPLSPPRTPPHLRASKLYTHRDPTLTSQPGISKVQKSKPNPRVAPRRPLTRTFGTPAISLHHRKGYVKYWHLRCQYVVISYEQYVKDYVSPNLVCHQALLTQTQNREELDKLPPEPMDFSFESPRFPFKTPYQREVCRRAKAQEIGLKGAVLVPWNHKGHQ